jgi:predicted RNA binding protein YcfA (HicA-like mRNA interferase family)
LKHNIKRIEKAGCIFIRHGGKHDWYENPVTGMYQPIPKHKEINEYLTKNILKKLSIE